MMPSCWPSSPLLLTLEAAKRWVDSRRRNIEDRLPPRTVDSWDLLKKPLSKDLGVSVNVIPKSMFEHLKLAQLKKTDMLVEMTDMTKRSPIEIMDALPLEEKTGRIQNMIRTEVDNGRSRSIPRRSRIKESGIEGKRGCFIDTLQEFISCSHHSKRRATLLERNLCQGKAIDGMITVYNGNDGVTYLMALSNQRFKHLTNAQCKKMRPLLKVSAQDKLNGISHLYQKLKSFYKGVLKLGPGYIRDAKIEEWITRRHVSIHEME
ncbi:hypothetical protein Tco_0458752 [Tanacetum coccineum]